MNILKKILTPNGSALRQSERATHMYVIGQPGTGKTRAIESWFMQDVNSGNGVGGIDPHGDLFNNLLSRLSMFPEIWDKVVIIDPCNPKWTVVFNPLEAIKGISKERLSLFMTDVVVKIWGLSASNSPRLIWLLTNSFLAISSLGLSLLDLPRFLLDTNFREEMLPHVKHSEARLYFENEFPKSPGAIHQWVTPVLNKIGGLIFDPDVRLMISGKSTINFRELIDQKYILLVNLPKGIIGEGASSLIGAFIVAHLQKAALSRANTRLRNPFYLYLDEFQNYTTDNIKDILSESRKYALSLILANQYLDQLSTDLRNAVLNTSGALICFRVGYRDAFRLVKDIFPSPGFISEKETILAIDKLGNSPFIRFDQNRTPLGWENLAMLLTEIPNREFWFRHRYSLIPQKHRTFDMPDLEQTRGRSEKINQLIDISGQRFGKLKRDIQLDQRKRHEKSKINPNQGGENSTEEESSPWSY